MPSLQLQLQPQSQLQPCQKPRSQLQLQPQPKPQPHPPSRPRLQPQLEPQHQQQMQPQTHQPSGAEDEKREVVRERRGKLPKRVENNRVLRWRTEFGLLMSGDPSRRRVTRSALTSAMPISRPAPQASGTHQCASRRRTVAGNAKTPKAKVSKGAKQCVGKTFISTSSRMPQPSRTPQPSLPHMVNELNPDDWEIGSKLQCYDEYLHKWQNAKIVGMQRDGASSSFKIHYEGWNAKWDEWVPLCSCRLRSKKT